MIFKPDTVQTLSDSPLGPVRLAASNAGLCGLWFEGQRHQPDLSHWPAAPQHPLLQQARQQLQDYFARQRTVFDLAFDVQGGTAFQQAVWQALLHIPYGSCSSYGALAAHIGKPAAVRAVGAAVGRNPLSIFIPCHRVLGASGALTGYAGGLARKQALLQLEGVLTAG